MARKKSRKKMIEGVVSDCKNVGTYKAEFLPTIEDLVDAEIQRDKTYEEFSDSGGKSLVTHVNKNGSENLVKNPLLVMWNEQNKTVLAYRRDLGLTPAGLKKLNEKALQPQKKNALSEAMKKLG